jgi:hypothetical protein
MLNEAIFHYALWRHTLLTLVLDGGELSVAHLSSFTHRKRGHSSHLKGGMVDVRAGLDAVEKRKIYYLF